jgi:hypothetical protein
MVASSREVDPCFVSDEQGRSWENRQGSEKGATFCVLIIAIIFGGMAFVGGLGHLF